MCIYAASNWLVLCLSAAKPTPMRSAHLTHGLTTGLALFLLLAPIMTDAQSTPFAKEVVQLINQARTAPMDFLAAHEDFLLEHQPLFIDQLLRSSAIAPAVWDEALADMARDIVKNGNLNPAYEGGHELCGFSQSRYNGNTYTQAMQFVLLTFQNVHNPDCAYIGLYMNGESYCLQWGVSCERTTVNFTASDIMDTSQVDFDRLNTAKHTSYLNAAERAMIREINFARAYPQEYAQLVALYLETSSNDGFGLTLSASEAGMELIEELKTLKPAGTLLPMECVFKAAKQHATYCEERGFLAHEGRNNSQPYERIPAACSQVTVGNENLVSGTDMSVRMAVMELLIDDGISGRGHRYNLLDPNWKYVGCYRYQRTIDGMNQIHFVQNFAH